MILCQRADCLCSSAFHSSHRSLGLCTQTYINTLHTVIRFVSISVKFGILGLNGTVIEAKLCNFKCPKCIFSTSVLLRLRTLQMPNLLLIETKRITVQRPLIHPLLTVHAPLPEDRLPLLFSLPLLPHVTWALHTEFIYKEWLSIPLLWQSMILCQRADCLCTATAIPFIYSFSGNSAASALISTFMCL
jgi:hypothetical protein